MRAISTLLTRPGVSALQVKLAIILVAALLVRIPLVPYPGQRWDMDKFAHWGRVVANNGLARVYAVEPDCDYPPLYLAAMGVVAGVQGIRRVGFDSINDGVYLFLLKLIPLAADLTVIVLAFAAHGEIKGLRWIIPLTLALAPGVILDSMWWGQIDGLMLLLILLSLIALMRQRPIIAWLFFALGLLLKVQTVILLPLLIVLTVRRCGVRTLVKASAIGAVVIAVVLTPIIIGSGSANALRPWLGSVGAFPVLTVYAPNLWLLIGNANPMAPDIDPLIAGVSYRLVGTILFGLYTLVILWHAWRHVDENRDFIWAGALYFGFFMLLTEMHERYLYPAAVLLLVGIVQDARLWPIGLVVMFTLFWGMANVSSPDGWQAVLPLISLSAIAVVNIVGFVAATWLSIFSPRNQVLAFE